MTRLTDAQRRVLHALQYLIEPEAERHLASTSAIARRAGLGRVFTRNALNRLRNKGLVCQPCAGEWSLTVDGGQNGSA
ncbi:hypothetical protein [uncultured Cohaesibacter sp.]|uniref:hypothetical protein n=1 Tax=uncultured Cohaesibacter sp. TaxID=1002546 RepID=UPI0029C6931F|nr:hypothetical protein [uncultured Cohaesibacter sp.]